MKPARYSDRSVLASSPPGKRGRKADRLASLGSGHREEVMYPPASFPESPKMRLPQTYGPVHHDPAYARPDGTTYSADRWLPRWRFSPGRLDGQKPGSDDGHGHQPLGDRQRRAAPGDAQENAQAPHSGMLRRGPAVPEPGAQPALDQRGVDAVIFWEALDPIQ